MMISPQDQTYELPIHSVIEPLRRSLRMQNSVVLQAEPGAGKTTQVPLALLNEPWLQGQKILMLEPRRIAAKSAALRMAQLIGEPVGERIGYRLRLERCCSAQTRIEVVTEGILTARLAKDPELSGVGLVIFDEFHERSLQSDLGLALCQEVQALRDQPLKILVMSATLDTTQITTRLGAASLSCPGRQHPVSIHYHGKAPQRSELISTLAAKIEFATTQTSGDILVFAPGQAEIFNLKHQLEARPSLTERCQIATLFGAMPLDEQQQLIARCSADQKQRIILATPIAQTSLTLDRISCVVDSGLEQRPEFDAGTGITRLRTQACSQATADQRAGRAGRLGPGICFRLWSEAEHRARPAFDEPELHSVDLSSMALALLEWGVSCASELNWIDPPRPQAWLRATDLLLQLGAATNKGTLQITPLGRRLARLPLEPRIGKLLLHALDYGAPTTGLRLAAILSSDRRAGPIDIGELLGSQRSRELHRLIELERLFARLLGIKVGQEPIDQHAAARLLIAAYPERIARLTDTAQGRYKLVGGKGLLLDPGEPLAREEWLIAVDLGGRLNAPDLRLRLGLALNLADIETQLAQQLKDRHTAGWDAKGEFPIIEQHTQLGALTLRRKRLDRPELEAWQQAVCSRIQREGFDAFNSAEAFRERLARLQFLRDLRREDIDLSALGELSEQWLLAHLNDWFMPALHSIEPFSKLLRSDLSSLLNGILPWQTEQWLESQAPEYFTAPSGTRLRIDYRAEQPKVSLKLQEAFGLTRTPILGNKIPLQLELLSPAGRPVALTHDLPHFWQSVYPQIRKELRGRYVKHPWPEDPLSATATRLTNAALRQNQT